MKKIAFALAILLAILPFAGCGKENNEMTSEESRAVTFVNGVREGDVWILAKTAKNLKTTVWGTADAQKVKTGESRIVPLCEPGDEGLYLFRMIDADGYYYAADGLELSDGWTVRIRETGLETFLDVQDGNGVLQKTYRVFSAKL